MSQKVEADRLKQVGRNNGSSVNSSSFQLSFRRRRNPRRAWKSWLDYTSVCVCIYSHMYTFWNPHSNSLLFSVLYSLLLFQTTFKKAHIIYRETVKISVEQKVPWEETKKGSSHALWWNQSQARIQPVKSHGLFVTQPSQLPPSIKAFYHSLDTVVAGPEFQLFA